MSTGSALVCKLGKPLNIEGADRIVQVNMMGETVIVGKNLAEGTEGLLFNGECQISSEFLSEHNLFRHTELNKDKTKAGYFPDNGRVRLIKLKGVKCSAFFMPLSDILWDTAELNIGQQIQSIADKPLCQKFVCRQPRENNRQPKGKRKFVPTFAEHFDTGQLEYNLGRLEYAPAIITSKLHGTSCRCGFLPVDSQALAEKPQNGLRSHLVNFMCKMLGIRQEAPYAFCVGSRRVVKSVEFDNNKETKENKDSYYQENIWKDASEKYFKGKLHKGETVYFEIVGHMSDGKAIMPGHKTEKLKQFLSKKDYKKWLDHYGPNLRFNYGCTDKAYDVYVYRITTTNQDGVQLDYSWDQVKLRCQEMDVKHVPELAKIYPQGDMRSWPAIIEDCCSKFKSQFCRHFPLTPFEGVCVRIDRANFQPQVFKSKTYEFKALEGILKETTIDIEEQN